MPLPWRSSNSRDMVCRLIRGRGLSPLAVSKRSMACGGVLGSTCRWLHSPTDFGFPIAVHTHEPDTIYVVPITSDAEHYPPEGTLRVYRSRTGGNEWEALTQGLLQRDCYVNVLRDAMAVDALDPCGYRPALRHYRRAGL